MDRAAERAVEKVRRDLDMLNWKIGYLMTQRADLEEELARRLTAVPGCRVVEVVGDGFILRTEG